MSVPRRPCANKKINCLALLLSLQGGLMGERTRPIAESSDKDARPLACTRL